MQGMLDETDPLTSNSFQGIFSNAPSYEEQPFEGLVGKKERVSNQNSYCKNFLKIPIWQENRF